MLSNRILFLGKKKDEHCLKALNFCQNNFENVTHYLGDWGEKIPEDIGSWSGEYIISYLSRWIVPEYLLNKAQIAAINFHPASPEYPGIGCNNFALYENAKEYGVTCHHMDNTVDTGEIIAVKKFQVFSNDNVHTLLSRTYDFQLVLFYEIMGKILNNEKLPQSKEKWGRKPFTRKEFNELGIITPNMDEEEIKRRIRAINYGPWKPKLELHGIVFEPK